MTSSNSKSTFVYVRDPEHAWLPATLLDYTNNNTEANVSVPAYETEQGIMDVTSSTASMSKAKEQVIALQDYDHQVLPLQNVDGKGLLQEYPDMVQLPYLHEVRYSVCSNFETF